MEYNRLELRIKPPTRTSAPGRELSFVYGWPRFSSEPYPADSIVESKALYTAEAIEIEAIGCCYYRQGRLKQDLFAVARCRFRDAAASH